MALEKLIKLESGTPYSYINLLGSHINFVNGTSVYFHGFTDETYRKDDKPPVHGSKTVFQLTEEENMELKELVAAFFYEKAKLQPLYKDAKDLI